MSFLILNTLKYEFISLIKVYKGVFVVQIYSVMLLANKKAISKSARKYRVFVLLIKRSGKEIPSINF